jgi:iron complex transport system permease protein
MDEKTGTLRRGLLFTLLSVILVLLFLGSLVTGTVNIPAGTIVHILLGGEPARPEWSVIVMDLRLPKAITALLAGMALSVSGLQMQTVFRNPLAGPYVLGISAGASLGVAIAVMGLAFISGSSSAIPGNWTVVVSAWLGSGVVLFLILMVSFRVRDIMTILILGIMFGSAVSAIVSVMQYFSTESMLKSFMIWTMGSLGAVTGSQLRIMIPAVAGGLLLSVGSVKLLNALLLGENYARTLGVNIFGGRLLVFLSTSLLAGTVTAFCGPIAFVGIAVPHLARIIFKNADHAVLVPATILSGGIIMLLGDIISQLPGFSGTIPINSVTALMGVPVIIWIVIRNQKLTRIF